MAKKEVQFIVDEAHSIGDFPETPQSRLGTEVFDMMADINLAMAADRRKQKPIITNPIKRISIEGKK